ncbi:MAG TPA: endonuclease domain-containing protein [Flavisolibacter sp.]|nr:endonuclease domain-containing protein [Flavisolibacter sp.]
MRKKMFSGADNFLFERASNLRKQQTFAEEILWNYLRTKPFGFKFRRQHPYSIYILDFYCHQLKLAIEVDGSIHNEAGVKQNDEIRQKQLEEEGLTFLRFSNNQIKLRPEDVVNRIEIFLKGNRKTNNDSLT